MPCVKVDTIDFLNTKIQEVDNKIKEASDDKYAKHLITIQDISHYAALLISSEIADIKRFPDYEHLSSYARLVHASINHGRHGIQKLILEEVGY
jgi:transposase